MSVAEHVGPRSGSIEKDFLEFHAANPLVYQRLVELTRQWTRRRGSRKVGMKMLFEVLRWEVAMKTTGDFKLNNNYTSYYARLIMERNPDLDGLFETRALQAPREVLGG